MRFNENNANEETQITFKIQFNFESEKFNIWLEKFDIIHSVQGDILIWSAFKNEENID